ncbi:MAG: hypothetical protein RL159_636 [Actinomycetota bacterium]
MHGSCSGWFWGVAAAGFGTGGVTGAAATGAVGIGELGVVGATGALDLVGAECCFKSRFGTGGVPGVVGTLLTALLVAEAPFEAGLYPAKKAFHSSGIEFGSRRYCS